MQNIKNKMHTVLTDLYKQDTLYTEIELFFSCAQSISGFLQELILDYTT